MLSIQSRAKVKYGQSFVLALRNGRATTISWNKQFWKCFVVDRSISNHVTYNFSFDDINIFLSKSTFLSKAIHLSNNRFPTNIL